MRERKTEDYTDILYHAHHVSARHTPMPLSDRAAQFSPFAALTGYGEAVEETARFVGEKRELDESGIRQLDAVLRSLAPGDEVTAEYFVPDGRKLGGFYTSVRGRVKKIDEQKQVLFLENQRICFEDILSLEISNIELKHNEGSTR